MKNYILLFLITSITYGQNIITGKFELKEKTIDKGEKITYRSTISYAPGLIENEDVLLLKAENFIYQKTIFDK